MVSRERVESVLSRVRPFLQADRAFLAEHLDTLICTFTDAFELASGRALDPGELRHHLALQLACSGLLWMIDAPTVIERRVPDLADVNLSVIRSRIPEHFMNRCFVGIAHHPFHAWKGGQFLRRALRVAPSHQNLGCRLLAVNFTHHLAQVVVGGGGDGAGVQDHQVGIRHVGCGEQSATGKPGFQRCAIGLRSSASKRFDEETLQTPIVSGPRTSLNRFPHRTVR